MLTLLTFEPHRQLINHLLSLDLCSAKAPEIPQKFPLLGNLITFAIILRNEHILETQANGLIMHTIMKHGLLELF